MAWELVRSIFQRPEWLWSHRDWCSVCQEVCYLIFIYGESCLLLPVFRAHLWSHLPWPWCLVYVPCLLIMSFQSLGGREQFCFNPSYNLHISPPFLLMFSLLEGVYQSINQSINLYNIKTPSIALLSIVNMFRPRRHCSLEPHFPYF